MDNFKAVGISYKNAPLAVREAVAFDEQSTKEFLARLKELLGLDEALVLSTCNRTEIYYFSPDNYDHQITALIDIFHRRTDNPTAAYFKSMGHDEALMHLFEVSIGLDSMVLGDIQITNQVKKAYQWSADESMAGPFLHRLLHTIFYTNKRVVQETSFRDGTASVASAAVEISQQYISPYSSPKIAILGLGEIGANVAENLKGTEAAVTLVNRTFERSEDLANELGFAAGQFSDLAQIVADSHVVISSVQVEDPIINKDMIPAKIPKLLIDLSVPRSISPDINEKHGVLLYNVDQLQQKTSEALERRQATIPEVKQIVNDSLEEFKNWSQEMEVSPTIKKFKEALEEIRQQEMARYVGKLDKEVLEVLEKASKNMIQKVIKLPVLQLKAACKRGEAESLVGVLNDLFNLEKEKARESER